MPVQSLGDGNNGCSLEVGPDGTLHVVAWGFWDPALSAAFQSSVVPLVKAGVRNAVLDATRLKPQRPEGQAALQGFADALRSSGAPLAVQVSHALTRLQLARVLQAGGVSFTFTDSSA